MKRLVLSFLSFVVIFSSNVYGGDELKLCTSHRGEGVYLKSPTIQKFKKSPTIAIKNKLGKKIMTVSDARGTPTTDFILQKIDIKNNKSCYFVSQIFDYYSDSYLSHNEMIMSLTQIFGGSDDKFLLKNIKQ